MSNGLINRQYVGARYVPKIMGEWNKALSYEALCVVTYMGNSFTSKVPVPANIEINNTDYWISTSNYNEQVENYREEVENYKNESDKIKNDLNTLTTDIKHERYLTVIGDSYTALPESNWAETLALRINKTLNKRSAGSIGFKRAIGGMTFTNALTWEHNDDYKNYTDILICYGGINDLGYTYEEEYKAVINFINKAIELYPYAKIIIAGCQVSVETLYNKNVAIIQHAISDACLNKGVSYVDPREWLLNNSYSLYDCYNSDHLHPSSLGFNIIASKMFSAITGLKECYNTTDVTFKPVDTSNITLSYKVTNDCIYVDGKTTGNFAANVFINLGEFNWKNIGELLPPYTTITCENYNTEYFYPGKTVGHIYIKELKQLMMVLTEPVNGTITFSGSFPLLLTKIH